jgi:hypothetical protein
LASALSALAAIATSTRNTELAQKAGAPRLLGTGRPVSTVWWLPELLGQRLGAGNDVGDIGIHFVGGRGAIILVRASSLSPLGLVSLLFLTGSFFASLL